MCIRDSLDGDLYLAVAEASHFAASQRDAETLRHRRRQWLVGIPREDLDPEQLTPEVCNRALARADDLRVLRYIPFEDIHMKA